MSDGHPRPSADPRLAALAKRLARVRGVEPAAGTRSSGSQQNGRALGLAFRIGAELVAGIAFGLLVGWGLDRLLGTAPLLLIVLTMLGAAAGLWSVIRTAGRMHRLEQEERNAAAGRSRLDRGTEPL